MNLHRRTFPLRGLAMATVALALFGCVSKPSTSSLLDGPKNGFPIVQGLTNKTATQITIVAPSILPLQFRYRDGEKTTILTSKVHRPQKPTTGVAVVTHHLQIENLKPDVNYTLEVVNAKGEILDHRLFQTLDLGSHPAKVATASCMSDAFLLEAHKMWKALVEAKPDLVMLIGDNVYAEGDSRFKGELPEEALWIRYGETFQTLDYYRTPDLIPTVVTWDDHDYGMRDGDATNPYKEDAKRTLEAFYSQTPSDSFPEFIAGPGVSSRLDAFGHRFLLLDNRSFRGETHFGPEQENWILQQTVTSSNAENSKPVWLISGDQWFGAYHRFESYEGRHPKSFKAFLNQLRKATQPILFMSGDRHLNEVMRIEKDILGYETYEFTSSALHSRMYPGGWDKFPNRRQISGIDLQPNFDLFEILPVKKGQPVPVQGSVIGPDSKVLYSFKFKVARPKVTKH